MFELVLLNTVFILLLTLFVVLLERKLLAYAQRRMGPAIMGRNGYFQIILDLVKLVTKETFLLPRPSTFSAPFILSTLFGVQLLFSQIFIFSTSLFLFEHVDALILYYLILIILSNIFFLLVGLISQSRYAIISSIRSIIHVLSLDIFLTLLYAWLVLISQSTNFHYFIFIQNPINNIFLYAPLSFIFIILLLLESKRAPFDHAETESEVVAGYAVEYGSGMLLIFYLSEYVHLVISGVQFILFFWGGWLPINLAFGLLPYLYLPHDFSIFSMI